MDVRQQLRKKRNDLAATDRTQFNQQITQTIIHLPKFQQSRRMAFYIADDGEVDPKKIFFHAQKNNQLCYLPVLHLHENHLEFYYYQLGDPLIKNRFGIGEPDIQAQKSIQPSQLDLVFVPVVAFDEKGHRLGRGVGYYDRTFAFLQNTPSHKPILIGLAYEFQKINTIAAAEWDVSLDMVVTEKNIYRMTACRRLIGPSSWRSH